MRVAIARRFGLESETDPLVILSTLRDASTVITGVDAETNFSFDSLVSRLSLNANDEVFVNWYRFDRIDRLAFSDLSQHFHNIWYPSADDIEVFDESLEWFALVRHDGCVSVLQFPQAR